MPVCIGGMHRSGTSLVARLLSECGLYLGADQDLMHPTPDNSDGYMENTKFVELNDEMLIKLGGSWGNPPDSPADWIEREASRDVRAKAAALLQEFQGREPWGWKDPRNSLTLPFWVHFCPGLKVVICLRHPLEVASSLGLSKSFTDYSLNMTLWNMYPRLERAFPSYQHKLSKHRFGGWLVKGFNQLQIRLSPRRRTSYKHLLGLTLWHIYNRRILEAVPPARRIVTHYDAFFRDSRAELRRVLDFLSIHYSDEMLERSCQLVSAKLRHNYLNARRQTHGDIPREISRLYQQMCAEAGVVDGSGESSYPTRVEA